MTELFSQLNVILIVIIIVIIITIITITIFISYITSAIYASILGVYGSGVSGPAQKYRVALGST